MCALSASRANCNHANFWMSALFLALDSQIVDQLKTLVPPICSPEDFLVRDSLGISQELRISLQDVEAHKHHVAAAMLNIIAQTNGNNAVGDLLRPIPTPWQLLAEAVPSMEAVKAIDRKQHYKTGLPDLDLLLGGGIPQGHLVGLIGDSQSGKTQCSLYAAVQTAMRAQRVLYIDTNNHLPVRRIHALVNMFLLEEQLDNPSVSEEARNEKMAMALGQISIEHVYDLYSLMDLLCKVSTKGSYHLIVVDCLHHVFAPHLSEVTANERFAPQQSIAAPMHADGRNVVFNGVANAHPLIAQCLLLLRALAGRPAPVDDLAAVDGRPADLTSVLITNVVSTTGALRRTMSAPTTGTAGLQALAGMTGGSAVFLDVFDALLLLSETRMPPGSSQEETIVRAGTLPSRLFAAMC